MTLDEFIGLIEPGDWHLDKYGNVTNGNDDCPVWYAYRLLDPDEDGDAEDYHEAGQLIGLRSKTVSRIATAADNRGEPKLRKRLLTAAGLLNPLAP